MIFNITIVHMYVKIEMKIAIWQEKKPRHTEKKTTTTHRGPARDRQIYIVNSVSWVHKP